MKYSDWFLKGRFKVLKTIGTFGLAIAAILVQVAVAEAAVPQVPCQIYGNVTVSGSAAPEGITVSAQINGVEYASTVTDSSGRYGYNPAFFRIPADDPDTPAKEGGVAGDTIQMYVAGNIAQTATFTPGMVINLNLTIASAITPPSVTTGGSGSITSTSVTLNGNLTAKGTATSVTVAFDYGPDTNYGNITTGQSMNATGAFTANLTGLAPGALYHFRAEAFGGVNGIAYGADMTFTTSGATAPVISTVAATGVTTITATLNSNLTSLGTAHQVELSFQWGTTTGYGSTTSVVERLTTGAYSDIITGLSPGTQYHYRAKADGGASGVAYGTDMTFTPGVISPTVTTNPATLVTGSTATLNGNLTGMGTANPVNVSFEYGLTTSYGSTTTAQAKAGTGAFTANLTNLTAGSTYHFRAKADGGVNGSASGADMTFGTSAPPPSGGTGGNSGGGGGGGGSDNTLVTSNGLSGSAPIVDPQGNVLLTVTMQTPDQQAQLLISAGTKMLGANGMALNSLSATKLTTYPTPPSNSAVVCSYDFGPGGSTFSPPITLTMTYDPTKLPAGVTESQLYIAYFDGTKWVKLPGTVDTTTHTITTLVSHFTSFGILGDMPVAPTTPATTAAPTVPVTTTTTTTTTPIVTTPSSPPASFSVANLVISPQSCSPGDQVNIELTVKNTGGSSGIYAVNLKLNGAIEKTMQVTLNPGASSTAIFYVSKQQAATYTVDVNGLSGSFTVNPPPTTPAQTTAPVQTTPGSSIPVTTQSSTSAAPSNHTSGANIGLLIGIIAAVVVLGLIGFMIYRRSQKSKA